MTLAVVGSRTFTDYETVEIILDALQEDIGFDIICSGGAKGADNLAEKYAWKNKIDLKIFIPEWDKYGKGAGFIRNTEIWDNSDYGVAFWDGKSKGTEHSFKLAKKQKKRLFVFNNLLNDFYEM